MTAYNDALQASEALKPAKTVEKVAPYSIALLCSSYMASRAFRDLRASTQQTYRNTLRRLENEYGRENAYDMARADVLAMIDQLTPGAAAMRLKLLRLLCRHMLDIGWRDTDPTIRIKNPKAGPGFPHWTVEDGERFLRRHPSGSMARLAFMLIAFTGQRRGDVVHMGRQHVQNGRIVITQSKTAHPVTIRILSPLQRELDLIPKTRLAFLVNAHGEPFASPAAFGNWFRDRCDEAGVTKAAHGLRKFLGDNLAEADASHKQIMAVLGHTTEKQATMYMRGASETRLADAAMDKLEGTELVRRFANL